LGEPAKEAACPVDPYFGVNHTKENRGALNLVVTEAKVSGPQLSILRAGALVTEAMLQLGGCAEGLRLWLLLCLEN